MFFNATAGFYVSKYTSTIFLQFQRQASILFGKVTSRLYLLGRWSLLSHKTKPKQKETPQSLWYEAKRKQANNTVSDPAATTTTTTTTINIIVSHQTDIFLCMDQQVAPTKNNTKRTLRHLLPPSKAPKPRKKKTLSLSPQFHLVHLLMILSCHWHLNIEHHRSHPHWFEMTWRIYCRCCWRSWEGAGGGDSCGRHEICLVMAGRSDERWRWRMRRGWFAMNKAKCSN